MLHITQYIIVIIIIVKSEMGVTTNGDNIKFWSATAYTIILLFSLGTAMKKPPTENNNNNNKDIAWAQAHRVCIHNIIIQCTTMTTTSITSVYRVFPRTRVIKAERFDRKGLNKPLRHCDTFSTLVSFSPPPSACVPTAFVHIPRPTVYMYS